MSENVDENLQDSQQLQVAKQEIEGADTLLQAVSKYSIETLADANNLATTVLQQIHEKEKQLIAKKNELIAPMKQAIRGIEALFVPAIDKLTEAKEIVKGTIVEYIQTSNSEGVEVKVEGTRNISKYKCTVEDPMAVPREFLCVDMKVLNSYVAKTKGAIPVPGVRIFKNTNIAVGKLKDDE